MITIPPTRTHKQLAAWINSDPVASKKLRAEVEKSWSSTDQQIPGSRLRWPGKGRNGVKLVLYPRSRDRFRAQTVIYAHDTAQTYRRHDEARRWVADFLNDNVATIIDRRRTSGRAFVNERVAARKHLLRLGLRGPS